jgi:hypothetical protein
MRFSEATGRTLRKLSLSFQHLAELAQQGPQRFATMAQLSDLYLTHSLYFRVPLEQQRQQLTSRLAVVWEGLRTAPALRRLHLYPRLTKVLSGAEGREEAVAAEWGRQLPGLEAVAASTKLHRANRLEIEDMPRWDTVE